MTARSWFKFFPQDWLGDPALRLCSEPARSLWIDMICLMNQAEPRGQLLIKGKRVTAALLAKATGRDATNVRDWLDELESNGVFSRKQGGIIFSRKIEREENLSRIRSKSGSKKWEKSAAKKPENGAMPTTYQNLHMQNVVIPESRLQKEDNTDTSLLYDPAPITGASSWHFRSQLEARVDKAIGYFFKKPIVLEMLVSQGVSLEQDIIPTVNEIMRFKIDDPPSSWSYFEKPILKAFQERTQTVAIVSLRASKITISGKNVSPKGVATSFGTPGKWGPMPHDAECRAPPELLLPDDGKDWHDWILD